MMRFVLTRAAAGLAGALLLDACTGGSATTAVLTSPAGAPPPATVPVATPDQPAELGGGPVLVKPAPF